MCTVGNMSATSQGGLLAVSGSFTVLSTMALGLRFYGRRRQKMSLQLDDWIALFGVVSFAGVTGERSTDVG